MNKIKRKGFALLALGALASGSLAYAALGAKASPEPRQAMAMTAPMHATVKVVARSAMTGGERRSSLPTRDENVLLSRVAPRSGAKREAPILTPAPTPLLSVITQPDILPEDQIFLDRVLRIAPALCRESLEHLVVRYDPSAERGQATASTMLLRGPLHNLPGEEQAEMIGVILHECGHVIDLGGLEGSKESGASAYPDGPVPTYNDDPSVAFYRISWVSPTEKRPGSRKENFVSEYAGTSDAFEDIASAVMYYALHEQAFRDRAAVNSAMAAKLAWLETYVFLEKRGVIESEPWDGRVVWDETKIPHAFTVTMH